MEKFDIQVFREGNEWVAQLMQHDIAAQGVSLWDALDELGRVITARLTIDDQLKINTFEELPPAKKSSLCECPSLLQCTCKWGMMNYPNKIEDDPDCVVCYSKSK